MREPDTDLANGFSGRNNQSADDFQFDLDLARVADLDGAAFDAIHEYGLDNWAEGRFFASPAGEMCVRLPDLANPDIGGASVSLRQVVEQAQANGLGSPLLLRFPGFLDAGIKRLNAAFRNAIERHGYGNSYRGVFPIKVNQQRQVIEEVARYGGRFGLGFEVGSKPELIAALAHLEKPGALLVCNGYKDEQFVRLALAGQQLGFNVVLVVEMPQDVETIARCAEAMQVEPSIGFRLKLSAEGYGYWKNSAGERSPFGINSTQLLSIVDRLRSEGRDHWITMLHCHQGSQITSRETVARSVNEAARVYAQLHADGLTIQQVNLGGGLAVNYGGRPGSADHAPDYDIESYADVVVETVQRVCRETGAPPPVLVTESGRAIAAPYAALVTKVHDVTHFETAPDTTVELPADAPEEARRLHGLLESTDDEHSLASIHAAAIEARDAALAGFAGGELSLRQRALCERIYWQILTHLAAQVRHLSDPPEEIAYLDTILSDQVYANFSIFQSLPDAWAINQVFPIAPLQQLNREPQRRSVINDITCDCDGVIDKYPLGGAVRDAIRLHDIAPGDDYYLGVFLVGAYQETLSDFHNLFGDTHVLSLECLEGRPICRDAVCGDSVADALATVKHPRKVLKRKFRKGVERAIAAGHIGQDDAEPMLALFKQGLESYTYLDECARDSVHGES